MRRPLPPELVELGDHLETAARRAVGQRRTRRQLVLNGMTSIAVAVPLVASLTAALTTPVVTPTIAPEANRASFVRGGDDLPPRNFRRFRARPNGDLLAAPADQRRALR